MESPLSSPERPPVTYLERKKRTLSNQVDSDITDSISKPDISSMTITTSPDFESSVSKGPKKVEISLPGPSPKRSRHDEKQLTKAKEPARPKKTTHVRSVSSISSINHGVEPGEDPSSTTKKPLSTRKLQSQATQAKEPAKPKKVAHVRSVSSISSINHVVEPNEDPSSATKKPLSTRKPQSKAKSVAAEDDDNVSVADSSISVKIRRNEAERIEYFQNQSECGKMEPRHVECLRCGKSVNLGRKQTYAVRPWEIHRARCDQKPAQTIEPRASPTTEKVAAEEAAPDTSISEDYIVRRQTEEERKSYLESDKQAETVEEGRVRCRKCQTWVILSDKQTYSTGKWVKHKSRCSDIVPSNRVAAARRKLLVVNDPQVKSFDARRIECTFCGSNVALRGEGDYNLTNWDEHKTQCTKSLPRARSGSLNSVPFPRQFSRSPPSPASTENTLITPESGPSGSSSSQSLKRNREEPDATAEDTERHTVRPRTESYVPPEETTGPFGLLLLPFKSFARGFRESLKNAS